jgi:hypothetical protein
VEFRDCVDTYWLEGKHKHGAFLSHCMTWHDTNRFRRLMSASRHHSIQYDEFCTALCLLYANLYHSSNIASRATNPDPGLARPATKPSKVKPAPQTRHRQDCSRTSTIRKAGNMACQLLPFPGIATLIRPYISNQISILHLRYHMVGVHRGYAVTFVYF